MQYAAEKPGPKTARAWKAYYARERAELGAEGLRALFHRAPRVDLSARGALIFPHTKARASGQLVAAVARAVIASGADEVLALGVLHGAREEDGAEVKRAREGDASARGRLRKVHDDRSPHVSEEFSLDTFLVLLDLAASIAGVRAPKVHVRHPFLVGDRVDDLPGLDELRALRARGCALVATTDPMHHGIGYGTPPHEALDMHAPQTVAYARARIESQLAMLFTHDFPAFQRETEACRSDFRDVGPVLAALCERARGSMHELVLVDYCDALRSPSPTWVAAPLVSFA